MAEISEAQLVTPNETERLVCVTGASLADAWPAVAAHVEALPNAAELVRAVAEDRAALWVVYDSTARAFFDVQAVAVVGVMHDAVRVWAASPGFLARGAGFQQMVVFSEAHRSGCPRVVTDLPPDLPRLAYEKAENCGVFRLPLEVDGLEMGTA